MRNPVLSGGDLQINSEIIPLNVFVRSINLSIMYDVSVESFLGEDTAEAILFRQILTNPT